MSIYAPVTNPILLGTQPILTPVTSPSTNQVPAYVYRLEYKPTGQFYYGYRMANIKKKRMPVDDFFIYYFTSSKVVKAMIKKYGTVDFHYDIIFESTDIDSVYWIEQQLIKQHKSNALILNKRYHSGTLKCIPNSDSATKACYTRMRNNIASPVVIKQWQVASPSGEVFVIENLEQFCRDRGLSASLLGSVDKGKGKHHKGWTCICLSTPPEVREEIIRNNTKEKMDRNVMDYTNDMQWIVTNPDGDEIPVKNLRRFSRDNGLDYACMRDVAKGRQQNHRGWKCECLSKDKEKTTYIWEVIDPAGNVYRPENFRKYCSDNGLNYQGMREVAAGRQHASNGWKCNKIVVEKPIVNWEITNPTGEVFITNDLRKFCEDNDLGFKQMTKISNGNTTKHRGGWKCKRLD